MQDDDDDDDNDNDERRGNRRTARQSTGTGQVLVDSHLKPTGNGATLSTVNE
jgi:hypothetical protein